jgi:hypothetical protein
MFVIQYKTNVTSEFIPLVKSFSLDNVSPSLTLSQFNSTLNNAWVAQELGTT